MTATQDSDVARDSLNQLANRYWYPLYAFARRLGNPPLESEDLTQGFFLWMQENQFFARADPKRGRFRSFLAASFRNFIGQVHRREVAAKRGGGTTTLSLGEIAAEQRYALEPAEIHNPETLFERRCALMVLDSSLKRLESECRENGRLPLFQTLLPILVGDSDQRHAELGERLGVTQGAVKTAVCRLRARLRELVEDELRKEAAAGADPEEEFQSWRRVLAVG